MLRNGCPWAREWIAAYAKAERLLCLRPGGFPFILKAFQSGEGTLCESFKAGTDSCGIEQRRQTDRSIARDAALSFDNRRNPVRRTSRALASMLALIGGVE